MIHSNIIELVGHTPLVEIPAPEGSTSRVVLKLESFNPGGSSKDRVALSMIEDAERKGILKRGGTIIEPTSGNTGVGLAWIAAVKGYKAIFTMPDTMSIERRNLLKAYGAEVVLTPGSEGMAGAIAKAEELCRAMEGAIIPGQFTNPANPLAHYRTTGKEIWVDTDGQIDIFVAGAGTGGTVSGTGKALKEHNPDIKVYAMEPASSPFISCGHGGSHKIQGIGAGFLPEVYDASVVDGVISVSDEAALERARMLAHKYGILCGISSGAALDAAFQLAIIPENAGKMIVALLPDTGERYLSTELINS